jgi:sialic acid synthase SpsE
MVGRPGLSTSRASPTCRIIGNLGDNHNGDPKLARHLAEIAISAGCDGIVLPHCRVDSSYTWDFLLQPTADRFHEYKTRGEALHALELSLDTIRDIREMCRGRLDFIGAPYDLDSFYDLQAVDPDAYQIEPPVLNHVPLAKAIAATGRPVLVVAGMCTEEDITAVLEPLGKGSLTLLHCVYTEGIALESIALRYIPYFRQKFDMPVGYMGLETGLYGAVAAVAMGATTIEKVFTSDKYLPGPSHATSLDRDELRELVKSLRSLEKAVLASPPRALMPSELVSSDGFQASLSAAYDLPAGSPIDESMLCIKLMPDGISPRLMNHLIGRRLLYDVAADTPLTFGVIEG